MPTLTELMIKISGDPDHFVGATREVRAQYRALQRDVYIASSRMTANMAIVGATMTASVTAPIMGAAAAAVKLSLAFEDTMARITGLTGVARDQVEGWRKELMQLSSDTGKGPQELGEALYFITSSGFQSAEAMEVLSLSAKAAAAGLGDTQKVADALTSIMNAYKGTTLTAAQATDVMVATVREGKAEADKIAGSIGHVAALAAEMGISFNDMGASIGALTRVGLDSAEAVTALKRVLSTLIEPSERARKVIAHFAKSTGNANFNFTEFRKMAQKDLIGTLLHIKDVMGGNLTAVGQVFGSMKALTGVLSLTGRQTEEVKDIFETLRDNTGDLDKAFEEASETVGFKMRQALAELQVAGIELGDSLGPILREITASVRELAKWFNNLDDEGKQQVLRYALLAAAIGPAVFAMSTLSRVVKSVRDAFLFLRTAQILAATKMGASATEALKLSKALQYLGVTMGMTSASGGIASSGAVLARLGVYGLAAAAAIGALYLAWKKLQELRADVDIRNYDNAIKDVNDSTLKSSKISYDENIKVKYLVQTYRELADKKKRTKEEAAKMQTVLNDISLLAPDLVTGFTNTGNAVDLVSTALDTATQKARDAEKALRIAASAGYAFQYQQNAQRADTVRERMKDRKAYSGYEKLPPPQRDPEAPWYYRYLPGGEEDDIRPIPIDPDTLKPSKSFEKELREDAAELARIARQQAELKKKISETLKGPINGTGRKPRNPNPTSTEDFTLPPNPKVGRDRVSEWEKLWKEYMDGMNDMQRELALNGDTSRKAAADWEVYHGSLSRIVEDGRHQLSEAEKQAYINRAEQVDMMLKAVKATELYKSTKEELIYSTAILGLKTDEEILAIDRSIGKYKDLTEEQFNEISVLKQLHAQKQRIINGEIAYAAALQKRREEQAAAAQDALSELAVLKKQLSEFNDVSELDKVNSMFAPGGALEKFKDGLDLGIFGKFDLKGAMQDTARAIDDAGITRMVNEYTSSLREQIDTIGQVIEVEKARYRITLGDLKFATEAEKERALNAARELDYKTDLYEADKAREEQLKKYTELYSDLAMQIQAVTGLTRQETIEMIALRDGITMAQAESIFDMQKTLENTEKAFDKAKSFADELINIFGEAFDAMFEDGFKGMIDAVLNGFRKMLRDMFLQWMQSQIYKALLKLGVSIFGGGGAIPGMLPDTSKPDLYPDLGGGGGEMLAKFDPIMKTGGVTGDSMIINNRLISKSSLVRSMRNSGKSFLNSLRNGSSRFFNNVDRGNSFVPAFAGGVDSNAFVGSSNRYGDSASSSNTGVTYQQVNIQGVQDFNSLVRNRNRVGAMMYNTSQKEAWRNGKPKG